jgi:hypothetical protein
MVHEKNLKQKNLVTLSPLTWSSCSVICSLNTYKDRDGTAGPRDSSPHWEQSSWPPAAAGSRHARHDICTHRNVLRERSSLFCRRMYLAVLEIRIRVGSVTSCLSGSGSEIKLNEKVLTETV